MPIDKTLVTRSTSMLILKLLENQDMYGYQMIEELARRSDDTFSLKAGTLYPLLHDLEKEGAIRCYEGSTAGRIRKYYSLTKAGRELLGAKEAEWQAFSAGVNKVLNVGAFLVGA